jgi:Asp-tRNA(Asn)/Glu-tRNA(Gln) amidotransferase A subunit family amidase
MSPARSHSNPLGADIDSLAAARTFASVAPLFASGQLLPSDELRAILDRIERYEPDVQAFAALSIDAALLAAAAADKRWLKHAPLSPIDGMVVGIKDIIETADMPTGQGSPIWAGTATHRDAASVQALREAGAIVVGKTTTTEFALTEALHRTRNPRDLARSPGGSSSGSAAAVAAGFVHAALGTQVIGSILRPASYCGCVGFKPTFGALNRGGSFDYFSQSCLGVLAASLADAWQLAGAIAARVGGDPGCDPLSFEPGAPAPIAPVRLAIVRPEGWTNATKGAQAAFDYAMSVLSASGVELIGASLDPVVARLDAALADVKRPLLATLDWEMRWPLATYRSRSPSGLSAAMEVRARAGKTMTLEDYRRLLAWRRGLRAEFGQAMAGFDAAVTLSATGAAPIGYGSTGDPGMNAAASTLGAPCISVPALADAGLPLGLQIIGTPGCDLRLIALAEWITRRLG